MHLAAKALQYTEQAVAVGVVDLPGLERLARLTQFVAAGQQRHAQPPVDLDPRHAKGRQQAEFLRAQTLAGLEQALAGGGFLATAAHVVAGSHRRQPDAFALDAAVFLGDHGIGTRRQRRAGEDAHRMPGRQLLLGGVTGGDAPGQRQGSALGRQVGGAKGVAVHRAVVPGRHRKARLQRLGEHAPKRIAQGDIFHRRRRRHPCQQLGNRLVDRLQAANVAATGAHERGPQ